MDIIKTEDPIEMLNKIWQFVHDHLNNDIKRNNHESAKVMGEVASFIRKHSSEGLIKQFNIKECS